jgi:hypothetical protein
MATLTSPLTGDRDQISSYDRHQRLCTSVPFPKDLEWEGPDLKTESRQRLYLFAEDLALSAIDWYNNKRKRKKNVSKSLRYSSYFFFIVGAALPLTKIFGPVAETLGGPLGRPVANLSEVSAEVALGLLGIAGGLHLIDRLIGASSGWMRYTVVAMQIQQKLLDFQFDWNERLGPKGAPEAVDGPSKDCGPKTGGAHGVADVGRAVTLFDLAHDFCDEIVRSVSDETEKWASEFSDSVAHFEQQLPGNSMFRRKVGQ